MNFINKLLQDSNGDPSSKRVAYIVGVLASIVWLSIGFHKWTAIEFQGNFTVFCALIGGGYVGGLIMEKQKKDDTDGN